MHLQRIQVPDFRVLKNVDITFEKEFILRIFPLGSLNGGGKSTLLQLIFVLLHCSTNPSRTLFIKNLLEGFKIQDGLDKRVIALFDVWDGDKSVKLEFFSYKDSSARNLLFNQDAESEAGDEVDKKAKDDDYDYIKFSVLEETKAIEDEISATEREMSERKSDIKKAREEKYEDLILILQNELSELINKLKELNTKHNKVKRYSDKVTKYLKVKKMIYICNYSVIENENDDEVLLCQMNNVDINKVEFFLEELSKRVFLAAPATQVFLFLSKESRKLLFRDISNDKNDGNNSYYSEI